MPIQTYNIYTGNKYAGQESDASTPRVTGSVTAAVAVDFGLAIKQDGTLGHSTGNVFGIALREMNHEATNRPSDGSTQYKATETISCFREGYINLEVTAEAATQGQKMIVNDTTGAFSGGTAGVGETATTNVTAMEDGQVGDVIRCRIDIL